MREEAQDALWGRRGVGDTAEGKREEGAEGEWGGWRESLGIFGLERPGGGPEKEAMPGAEAQQARGGVGVFYKKGDRRRM